MACVETSLYLTRKFYCFVEHKYSDFSFHFMWQFLKVTEIAKHRWQTLLGAYHLVKQTNKSISNRWFQTLNFEL